MNRSAVCLVVAVAWIAACPRADPPEPCSEAWTRWVEERVPTGDGRGHGPDVGSEEWKSVVEFKLGIRGAPDVPERESDAWCRHVDEIVRARSRPGAGRRPGTAGAAAVAWRVRAGDAAP